MMTSVRSTLQVGQFLSISFFSLFFDDKSNLLLFKCPQCIINLLSDSVFSNSNDSRRHTIVFIWSNRERERERVSIVWLSFVPVSLLEIIKIMETMHEDIMRKRIEEEGYLLIKTQNTALFFPLSNKINPHPDRC